MTLIEAVAAACGFLAVWLTVRQHIWCWPIGLVQVALYVGVFFHARLYSDMVLHLIYVVLQIYGWYHWLHGGAGDTALRVSSLTGVQRWIWLAVVIGACLAWGTLMHRYTDAAAPYPDAFIAAASLVAQWLTTRKQIESWYFWIAVDVVAITVYWYKHLYLTTALYGLFLAMCVVGVRQWRLALTTPPGVQAAAA